MVQTWRKWRRWRWRKLRRQLRTDRRLCSRRRPEAGVRAATSALHLSQPPLLSCQWACPRGTDSLEVTEGGLVTTVSNRSSNPIDIWKVLRASLLLCIFYEVDGLDHHYHTIVSYREVYFYKKRLSDNFSTKTIS